MVSYDAERLDTMYIKCLDILLCHLFACHVIISCMHSRCCLSVSCINTSYVNDRRKYHFLLSRPNFNHHLLESEYMSHN